MVPGLGAGIVMWHLTMALVGPDGQAVDFIEGDQPHGYYKNLRFPENLGYMIRQQARSLLGPGWVVKAGTRWRYTLEPLEPKRDPSRLQFDWPLEHITCGEEGHWAPGRCPSWACPLASYLPGDPALGAEVRDAVLTQAAKAWPEAPTLTRRKRKKK